MGINAEAEVPSPPRCHGVGVLCPFGTGEPIRRPLGQAAAGKSWHFWCQTHVVIASSVELENTDKTPVALCSDTDGGTLLMLFSAWH